MKLIFRGVRGSIPSPGPDTVRYGGNTTCLEVRTDANHLIILDAGTGIFPLARELLSELPLECHIFITHTHWDHIQGLPFFIPLFVKDCRVNIYGAYDPVGQRSIKDVLARQMDYSYFPIHESQLDANIGYHTVIERQSISIGDAVITPILLNHPVINYGYRVECNGKSLFFTGDHEWPYNIYDPEDEAYADYQQLIDTQRATIVDFIRDLDVLIMDSSYTTQEYQAKRGWGHGTYDTSLAVANEVKCKHLFFTHHEPTRSDQRLEGIFAEILGKNPAAGPQLHLAREGLIFEL